MGSFVDGAPVPTPMPMPASGVGGGNGSAGSVHSASGKIPVMDDNGSKFVSVVCFVSVCLPATSAR